MSTAGIVHNVKVQSDRRAAWVYIAGVEFIPLPGSLIGNDGDYPPETTDDRVTDWHYLQWFLFEGE